MPDKKQPAWTQRCPICDNPNRQPVKEPTICPVCGKLIQPPGEFFRLQINTATGEVSDEQGNTRRNLLDVLLELARTRSDAEATDRNPVGYVQEL